MKVSNINARADTSGKHNDRNFDLDKAPHINQDRIYENEYYTYNNEHKMTFRELELEFYHNHFEQALERQNKKHKKAGHLNRIRSIEQYYRSKKTMPEDKILQIGDINEHATKEELWKCALEYKDRFEEIYGEHCVILDMALHMDEATPHVHVRRVWIAEDEQGHETVNQSKALDQLGILPPNPHKEVGRYNNAKMTFTQTDIELFKTVCYEHGLDIEMERSLENRGHMNTKQFKSMKKAEEYDKTDEIIRSLAKFVMENPYLINAYEDELEEAEEKGLAERARVLAKIMVKEFEALHGQIDISNKKERFEQFIIEEGLMDEYDEWMDDKSYEFIEDHGLAEKYEDFRVKQLEREERRSEQDIDRK